MSYRTILVHCNDKRRIEKLLAPTVGLAEEFQAHLIGLSVVPPVAIISMGIPDGPPIVVDDHCKLYREESLCHEGRRSRPPPVAGHSLANGGTTRPMPLAWQIGSCNTHGLSILSSPHKLIRNWAGSE